MKIWAQTSSVQLANARATKIIELNLYSCDAVCLKKVPLKENFIIFPKDFFQNRMLLCHFAMLTANLKTLIDASQKYCLLLFKP